MINFYFLVFNVIIKSNAEILWPLTGISTFFQVDRSGAYAVRWIAKSLVAAKLCRRVLVQVSYAIGIAKPLSVTVFSYGTSEKSEVELLKIVKENFDLRPGMIVK